MVLIAIFIFIVGISCASAVNLDFEKGTNANVNKMVKNSEVIPVSSSNLLGSSANTKQNPGDGMGCARPVSHNAVLGGSSGSTKWDTNPSGPRPLQSGFASSVLGGSSGSTKWDTNSQKVTHLPQLVQE